MALQKVIMKRAFAEILLVLALVGAAAFGWLNLQKGNLANSNVAALETKVKATEHLLQDLSLIHISEPTRPY